MTGESTLQCIMPMPRIEFNIGSFDDDVSPYFAIAETGLQLLRKRNLFQINCHQIMMH